MNNVVRTSYTSPSVMFDGGSIIGKIGFSSTTTSSDKEPGAVYSYVDFGNEANSGGLGFNAFDYIGGEIGASTEGNVFVNGQLGQAVHGGVSFGFDGIGLSAGFNIENTSYDFEIKAGWGTIVFWYLAPYLGGAVY